MNAVMCAEDFAGGIDNIAFFRDVGAKLAEFGGVIIVRNEADFLRIRFVAYRQAEFFCHLTSLLFIVEIAERKNQIRQNGTVNHRKGVRLVFGSFGGIKSRAGGVVENGDVMAGSEKIGAVCFCVIEQFSEFDEAIAQDAGIWGSGVLVLAAKIIENCFKVLS